MSASLTEVLLRIAAAVAADSGAAVRKALEEALLGVVPFDAGELALVRSQDDTWRQPLGKTEGPILGRDLLEHVLTHGAPYRIDDWREAEPFEATASLLRARALRSLLTVPFRFDAPGVPPVTGALAVGRSHGWGFVGASLPFCVPVASMAGLAFDRALALTTLRERAQALESVSPRSRLVASTLSPQAEQAVREHREETTRARAAAEEARRTAAQREGEASLARTEAEAARGEAGRAKAELREAQARGEDLHARAEAAETRLREAERSRDDFAQEAAALRARTEEQEAEIQSLRRGMAGARETAAAAADVAEAGEARIRELQERTLELENTIRALESAAPLAVRAELAEAAQRVASQEDELRRARDESAAITGDRDALSRRLDETSVILEETRCALASTRNETEAAASLARDAQAERARLERDTSRLEDERGRLEEALKQAEVELEIALDQIAALSLPPQAPQVRGGRVGRSGRRQRPR